MRTVNGTNKLSTGDDKLNDAESMEPLPDEPNDSGSTELLANEFEFNDTGSMEPCPEDFYYDENGTQLCQPICGKFLARDATVQRVVISIGFVLSVLMLFLVVPLQRETLYVEFMLGQLHVGVNIDQSPKVLEILYHQPSTM